jgi:hypothetical protein
MAGDLYAKFQKPVFQLPGKVVDRGKFGKIMCERIGCGRSEKARLSHSSTKALPEPARARNELLAPNQARTNGST